VWANVTHHERVSVERYAPDPVVAARTVSTLAVLGDSIGVGVGDPAIGGGWRGFAPLLAEAFGEIDLVNVSVNGARIAGVRVGQLPAAVAARPDAAVVVAGMNDTLRSDYDPNRIRADLDAIVSALTEVGSLVVLVRYHDHGKVFRLPGALHRALTRRISRLNTAIDDVALRYGVGVVDLDTLPGTYLPGAWSVDRLHPSEWGHRMLARALAGRLAAGGAIVRGEVSQFCGGSRPISRFDHVAWLVLKGIPWVARRGADLLPYLLDALFDRWPHGPEVEQRRVEKRRVSGC
jgi:lysophospholipase L1-like esterase